MFYKYFVLLLTATIVHTYAQIPQCNRQVPSVDNYDNIKMRGIWYVIEAGNEYKSKKRCMQAIVSSEHLVESGFVNGKLDEVDVTLHQIGSKAAYIAASREFVPTITSVIDTDYTSFGVWFVCRNDHPQGGIVYITARTAQPSTEIMTRAHKSLLNAGFKSDTLKLFPVNQKNCQRI